MAISNTAAIQRRWLLSLAEATISRLRRSGLDASVKLVRTPRLRAAEYNGWYLHLGSFSHHKGGLYLFLDESLGQGRRTIWYGAASPTTVAFKDLLRRAKRVWPGVESWENNEVATRERVSRPFTEPWGRGEFYFGKYEWYAPDFRQGPVSVARRVSDFLLAVDKLWSSAPRDKEFKRIPRTVAARRGQQQFRSRLLIAYSGRCCVTGSHTEALLEAAHLEVKAGSDIHSVSNGILVRSDIHTLYDLGLLAIHPTSLKIWISEDLANTEYSRYNAKRISLPIGVDPELFRRRLGIAWKTRKAAKRRRTSPNTR